VSSEEKPSQFKPAQKQSTNITCTSNWTTQLPLNYILASAKALSSLIIAKAGLMLLESLV